MKKKFFLGLIILIILFLMSGIFLYFHENYRFKIEYEIYNNIKFSNGKTIKVDIPTANNIKYGTEKNLTQLLTTGTSIIYFGYPRCPWCRNVVSILLEVANENKTIPLYYIDVEKISTYGISEILEEYLEEDEEGNKKLYVPDVYFIKDGKIVMHHLGTVESYKNAFLGMNKEQIQELKEIYQNGIDLIKGDAKDEK